MIGVVIGMIGMMSLLGIKFGTGLGIMFLNLGEVDVFHFKSLGCIMLRLHCLDTDDL
jgi:hypothetical protein